MKLRLTVAAALTIATVIGAQTTPLSAAPNVRFGVIQYDPPGSDTPITNAKLNAEWVTIRNPRRTAVQLRGWTVRDPAGHVYRFGRFRLGPGRAVRVHTGSGNNTRTDRYWRMDNYVWNNSGDTARLRNAAGVLIDTCTWPDGDGTIACP